MRRGGFFVVVKRVAQYEVIENRVATVIPAAAPETLYPTVLLHPSTVAHILTSKFALGVPHYRIERDLLDQGMCLDRGLMSRYVEVHREREHQRTLEAHAKLSSVSAKGSASSRRRFERRCHAR